MKEIQKVEKVMYKFTCPSCKSVGVYDPAKDNETKHKTANWKVAGRKIELNGVEMIELICLGCGSVHFKFSEKYSTDENLKKKYPAMMLRRYAEIVDEVVEMPDKKEDKDDGGTKNRTKDGDI